MTMLWYKRHCKYSVGKTVSACFPTSFGPMYVVACSTTLGRQQLCQQTACIFLTYFNNYNQSVLSAMPKHGHVAYRLEGPGRGVPGVPKGLAA